MGRSSRRKRERREESAGGQPQSPRHDRAGDGEDRAVTRVIRADHAKGMLIGDQSVQINYFSQVTADGDAVVLPTVQADLPAESRVFCGRDVHLAELLELLNPEAPATTPKVALVSGMPGVGKSELALHAAHVAVRNGWFPGGVLFVTLHGGGLEVAQTALDGFLSAMGIPGDRVPADPRARARLFSSLITRYAEAGRPVLVVIDNATSAGQCELLMPGGGRAMATSRNDLAILDARLIRLPVLGEDAGADLIAGQLDVSLGSDSRVADHPDDARAVVRLCGGLPLALRIVTAILAGNRARPLVAVAAALQDARTRLDELEWERGGEVLAVRAAFDVSHRELEAERSRVFRLLAVNPGPEISAQAAAVLVNLDERAARRHLEGLAGAHLIEPGVADGRWRMHDLIRIYAAEEPPDGTDDALARLLAFYIGTANAATASLAPATRQRGKRTFPGRAEALEWLDREYPNMAAIAMLPVPDPAFADVALGLWLYFELRWRINDGIMLTRHALSMARQLGDRGREARAQANLAGLFRHSRMFDAALDAGQAAVGAYRSQGDHEGTGIALNNLAAAQMAAQQFGEAIATAREAAAIFRSLGDRQREGIALGHTAIALQETGQLAESIAAYRGTIGAMREAGDSRSEGAGLLNLGNALQKAGRLDEAVTAEEEAAATLRELGDRRGEGTALNNLAGIFRQLNREHEAIAMLRRAVDALADAGDAHSHGAVQVSLGQVLLIEGGHPDEAIAAFTGAGADYRETRDRAG